MRRIACLAALVCAVLIAGCSDDDCGDDDSCADPAAVEVARARADIRESGNLAAIAVGDHHHVVRALTSTRCEDPSEAAGEVAPECHEVEIDPPTLDAGAILNLAIVTGVPVAEVSVRVLGTNGAETATRSAEDVGGGQQWRAPGRPPRDAAQLEITVTQRRTDSAIFRYPVKLAND